MRVMVFEQWQGGHYFNYLECLVPRLASCVDEVVVAITEVAYRSTRFAELLQPLERLSNVRFDTAVPLPKRQAGLAVRLSLGRHLVEAIRRNAPDYVFLPSADEQVLVYPLSTLGLGRQQVPVEAVLHYQSYVGEGSARQQMVRATERALLATGAFARLNFVNFLQYEDARRRSLPLVGFAQAVGDPVPQPPTLDRQEARAALGLDRGGRLLGMVGGLDERKAVLPTVRAFAAARLATDDRLLLAGRLHPSHRGEIDRAHAGLLRAGRLILLDRFLSDTELRQCNAALDLNCSIYVEFQGLSSLLLKSLAADVPVLTNRGGWGSAVVRRFQVGQAVDPADTGSFSAMLPGALDDSAGYRRSDAVGRLLRFHSIDNFTAGLTDRCVRLAGKQPAPFVDWAWVMDGLPPERRALR